MNQNQKHAHTPGPWEVDYHGRIIGDNAGTTYEIVAEMPQWFGNVKPGHATQGHLAANARLIAAAPDLLEALEGLFEHCAMMHKHWGDGDNTKEADSAIDFARAAIARATGQEA